MNKEAVERMIDNMIKKSFQEGQSPIDITNDLEKRSKNIFRIIDKEKLDMSSLFGVLINVLSKILLIVLKASRSTNDPPRNLVTVRASSFL